MVIMQIIGFKFLQNRSEMENFTCGRMFKSTRKCYFAKYKYLLSALDFKIL